MTSSQQSETFTREYVRLRRQTIGVLYSPTRPGPRTSVGLVVMHPNSNYLDHIAGAQMAQRGFRVLCVNGQYVNTRREYLLWEKVPLDVKAAVDKRACDPHLVPRSLELSLVPKTLDQSARKLAELCEIQEVASKKDKFLGTTSSNRADDFSGFLSGWRLSLLQLVHLRQPFRNDVTVFLDLRELFVEPYLSECLFQHPDAELVERLGWFAPGKRPAEGTHDRAVERCANEVGRTEMRTLRALCELADHGAVLRQIGIDFVQPKAAGESGYAALTVA